MVEEADGALLGFLTREFTARCARAGSETLVAVYVPTNHLYLGDVRGVSGAIEVTVSGPDGWKKASVSSSLVGWSVPLAACSADAVAGPRQQEMMIPAVNTVRYLTAAGCNYEAAKKKT